MNVRILKPEEWVRLKGSEIPDLMPFVAPQNVAVIVAEDEHGEIIGTVMALQVTHLEGFWIDPKHRGGIIPRALLRQAYAMARMRGECWMLGGAADDDERMDDIMLRLKGRALPVKFYTLPVRDC